MALELVATIALGFGLAGLALLLRRLTGGVPGRWIVPAAAAAGMFGYQIWAEYTWFDRTAAVLPAGLAVTHRVADPAPWRPWSYLFPAVTRFAAVDAGGARRNPAHPELRIADYVLLGRHDPAVRLPQIFDCAGQRRADLGANVTFGPDGAPEGAVWTGLAPDDPALRALCAAD